MKTVKPNRDPLENVTALFVRRWGEMATTWGISRTMAELHALLYITGKPLCADDVMEKLQVSRGNASTNLRLLVNWGLVRRTHHRGDRKDYYICNLDAWELFETITRERRRREVEPIIDAIERCREQIAEEIGGIKGEQLEEAKQCDERLEDMLSFIHTMNALLNLVLATGRGRIGQLTKTLAKLTIRK